MPGVTKVKPTSNLTGSTTSSASSPSMTSIASSSSDDIHIVGATPYSGHTASSTTVDLTDDSTDFFQQVVEYESKHADNFQSDDYLVDDKAAASSNDNQVCPVCSLLIPSHLMNSHIDKCLQHQSQACAQKKPVQLDERKDSNDDDIDVTSVVKATSTPARTQPTAAPPTPSLKFINMTTLPPLSLSLAACQICCSTMSTDLLVQSECGHNTCLRCCNESLIEHIPKPAEDNVIDVTGPATAKLQATLLSQCPIDGCERQLNAADIARALTSTQQQSAFQQIISQFVSSLTQQQYCAHCKARLPKLTLNTVLSLQHIDSLRSMINDTADNTAECNQCNQPICSLCPEQKLSADDNRHSSNCTRQAAFYLYLSSEILKIAQTDKAKQAKTGQRAAAAAAKSILKTPKKAAPKRKYSYDDYDSDGNEISETSSSAKKGTGYGGRSQENTSAKAVAKKVAKITADDQRRDRTVQLTLDVITQILRRFDGLRHTSDVVVYALFSQSYIRNTLTSLLRNDSIVDMSSRFQLYHSTLQLLSAIAATPPIASTLLVLRPLLASLSKQAKFFLSHSASNLMTEESNSLGLCADINDITQRVDDSVSKLKLCDVESLPSLPTAAGEQQATGNSDRINTSAAPAKRSRRTKGVAFADEAIPEPPTPVLTEAEMQMEATALKQLSDLKFDTHTIIDDYKSNVDKSYYFASKVIPNAQPVQVQHHHPGYPHPTAKAAQSDASRNFASKSRDTSNRLRKELSTLASGTALPDGVYVRVDESRMDVLRFMLVGPEATPYSFGCFLFDVYIPDTYPQIPPQVQLLTTGQSTFRFNPNLYADGKVCLSLLGTWSGPGWDPKMSTILQVIISIQSMILIDKPYFNEPGYQSSEGTPHGEAQSEAYNRAVRHGTLQYAMLDNLRSPPRGFDEIVKQHFLAHRSEILRLAAEWEQQEAEMLVKEQAKKAEAKARYDKMVVAQQAAAAKAAQSSQALSGGKQSKAKAKKLALSAATSSNSTTPTSPSLQPAYYALNPMGVMPFNSLGVPTIPTQYTEPVDHERYQQVVPVAVEHIVVNLKAELAKLVKQCSETVTTTSSA